MNTGTLRGSKESFKTLKDWTCEVLNINARKREGRDAGKHQSEANFLLALISISQFLHSLPVNSADHMYITTEQQQI